MNDQTLPIFERYELGILKETLSYFIRLLNLELSRDLDRKFQGLEVAKGTGKITTLFLVRAHPGIRASDIAVYTGKDAPGMARVVENLVSSGLIERRADSAERRAQSLFITERGLAVAGKAERIIARERQDFFAFLSDAEHRTALDILRKTAEHYARMRT